jgi:hypothetical protein
MTVEIVDTFPHAVNEFEFERIPLSDSVHLSCRYWLPENTDKNPVPAILEYIPYCAGHGYAAVRVDNRAPATKQQGRSIWGRRFFCE